LAQPFLSVVVPAYNEEPRIQRTLDRVTEYLSTRQYLWEVVVSDDGSTDNTSALVELASSENPNIRLLTLPHRGKGWAVKNAMLAATGDYRLICDADLSVPIEQVERLLPPRLEGVDIALGSREQPGSRRIGEPTLRHVMGRVYNRLVRSLTAPGLKDTQCGFKCFRGDIVSQLFQLQTMDGFAFDAELLFLAHRRGLTVKEVGIDWYYGEGSKVRPVRDSLSMTGDLLKIRWAYLMGRYSGAGLG
jgi:dolichyl-phosphate beta-glucosyltransferase